MGIYDFNSYVPNGQYLSPEQKEGAQTQGWMGVLNTIAQNTAPHFGNVAPKTLLQMVSDGVQGYGQGANGYVAGMNNTNNSLMSNLETQRALQHFYPDTKAGAMAGAIMPQAGAAPQSPFASFYGGATPPPVTQSPAMGSGGAPSPNAVDAYAVPQAPQMNATDVAPGAPPSPGISLPYPPPGQPQQSAPPAPAGQPTSFGTDVRTMARNLYQQGVDMSYIPKQAAAGTELMKQAISMDPTILQSNSYATSQGQLPAELSKISATGAQSRQTAGVEAGYRPHVITNADGTTTNTNDRDAAAMGSSGPRAFNPQQTSLMQTDQKTVEQMQPEYDAAQNGLAAVAQIKQLAEISSKNALTKPGPLNAQSTQALALANDIIRRAGGKPVAANELASSKGIDKLGTEMKAAATKILGTREAAQIFTQMGATTPSAALDPATLKLIADTSEQKFQRVADRYNALTTTMASPNVYNVDPKTGQYVTGINSLNAYDKVHPGSEYGSRAIDNAGVNTQSGWSIKRVQ